MRHFTSTLLMLTLLGVPAAAMAGKQDALSKGWLPEHDAFEAAGERMKTRVKEVTLSTNDFQQIVFLTAVSESVIRCSVLRGLAYPIEESFAQRFFGIRGHDTVAQFRTLDHGLLSPTNADALLENELLPCLDILEEPVRHNQEARRNLRWAVNHLFARQMRYDVAREELIEATTAPYHGKVPSVPAPCAQGIIAEVLFKEPWAIKAINNELEQTDPPRCPALGI